VNYYILWELRKKSDYSPKKVKADLDCSPLTKLVLIGLASNFYYKYFVHEANCGVVNKS